LKKVYHIEIDTVCVTLIVDVYMMLCMHDMLFYAYEAKGRREPVGGEDGVVVFCTCVCIYIFRKKGPMGVGRCEEYGIVCC